MNYTKAQHGFALQNTHLTRQLWDPAFMADVHNVLIEPSASSQEKPVLLGAVETSNNLPKWFPFKVQYQFSGWEYTVHNLWLIANNHRVIFVVHAHPHDLAQLYARYAQAIRERKTAAAPGPVVTNPEETKWQEQSATTASAP